MKQFASKSSFNTLIALLLLIAQGLLVIHETDIQAHVEPDGCEACLHLSHMNNAVHAAAQILTSANFLFAFQSPQIVVQNRQQRGYKLPQPRAPPSSSYA